MRSRASTGARRGTPGASCKRRGGVEAGLEAFADLKRRYRAQTLAELAERGRAARQELAAIDGGRDPVRVAEEALTGAETAVVERHSELRAARAAAARPFAEAVAEELRGI